MCKNFLIFFFARGGIIWWLSNVNKYLAILLDKYLAIIYDKYLVIMSDGRGPLN